MTMEIDEDSDSDGPPEELTKQEGLDQDEEMRRQIRIAHEQEKRRGKKIVNEATETEPHEEAQDEQGMLSNDIANLLAAREKSEPVILKDIPSSFIENSSNKFGSFIFLSSVCRENTVFTLELESGSNSIDTVFTVEVDNLGRGGGGSQQPQKIVGSGNGLISLYDIDLHKFSILNPITKEVRILPKPIAIGGVYLPRYISAFGFDLQTKDYKVVLLTGFPPPQFYRRQPIECRVQVYSLSTNSWRLVEGITSLPGDPFQFSPMEVQYVNGSCFFLARFFRTKHYLPCIPENDRFIIKFDLTKEIITPIQLPDHHRDQELFLSCLADDKIALFIVNYQHVSFDDYCIWTLLIENGSSSSSVNKDSWTKLHSFQVEAEVYERNIPRGISNDGRFVLLQIKDSTGGFGKRMKLYDPVSKVTRNFLSCGSVESKAHAYKRTLDPIIGAKDAA